MRSRGHQQGDQPHTGAALASSATTTTTLGFAVLLFGSILPFRRLGLVTMFATTLSSLAVIFVLLASLVLYGCRNVTPPADDAENAETTTDALTPV
ncbi:MAG: hypothetical protein AAFP84_09400 [Actinomycetota bacterium]